MQLEIIWSTHKQYIIRDVCVEMIGKVKRIMLEKYFKPHRLFKHLKINRDKEAVQYMKYLDFILQDECSVAVINQETNEIKAVALLKCMTEEFYSWTYLKFFLKQSKFTEIIDLHYNIIHADVEHSDSPIDSLYLFEFYIDKELKWDEELMAAFFDAINETARHLRMPRVACLALSQADQELLQDHGYAAMTHALYSIYTDIHGRSFAALREIDEAEAILYEMVLDPLTPFEQWPMRASEDSTATRQSLNRPSIGEKRAKSLQFGMPL